MYKLVIGKIENQGNRVLLYPKENTEVVWNVWYERHHRDYGTKYARRF